MSTAGTNIEIPDFALVVLIGSTGSGKSTFAAKHFLPTEVISSDRCRGLVSDNENDQGVSGDAFDLVREIAGKRLKNRGLPSSTLSTSAPRTSGFARIADSHTLIRGRGRPQCVSPLSRKARPC
jgi:hypothetical protein